MAYRIDIEGTPLEVSKNGNELIFAMHYEDDIMDLSAWSVVPIEDLKNIIRAMEEQDG